MPFTILSATSVQFNFLMNLEWTSLNIPVDWMKNGQTKVVLTPLIPVKIKKIVETIVKLKITNYQGPPIRPWGLRRIRLQRIWTNNNQPISSYRYDRPSKQWWVYGRDYFLSFLVRMLWSSIKKNHLYRRLLLRQTV